MSALATSVAIGQLIATVLVVATFAVQRKQFRVQHTQTQGQNAFNLVRYLEEPDHLAARKVVTGLALHPRPMDEWTSDETEAVDVVCRVWQMAATFHEEGVMPERFLEKGYGGTIVRHWKVCAPYVRDLRARTDNVNQRSGFERMAERFVAMGI